MPPIEIPDFAAKTWVDEVSPLGPPADPDAATPVSAEAAEDLEVRLATYTKTIGDLIADALAGVGGVGGVGAVIHDDDKTVARPEGFAVVFWFGTVQPDNMDVNDVWFDTSS
jgi:hypothetical protein